MGRSDVERVKSTLALCHHYWMIAAKEALQGDMGKLRAHVAIAEGRTIDDVYAEMGGSSVFPAGATTLADIVRRHTAVGGYPNTHGIAAEAFELGRSACVAAEPRRVSPTP